MNVIKILNNVKQKVKISKEDIEQAMKTCSTREQLANYFGVSLSTIKRRLKEFNLSTFKRVFSEEEFERYYKEGLTDAEIARRLNVSNATISNYRNSLNLKSNFSYNRDLLREKILKSNLTEEELSDQLGIDIRVITYFKTEPKIDSSTYELSAEEYQIIIGSLLGDGNLALNKSKNLGRFTFAHSEKQKEYAIWKTEKLKNIMYYERVFNKKEHFDKRTNKIYSAYFSYSKDLSTLKDLYLEWYNECKYVPVNHLMNLNALGLAIWFMDDGYKVKNTYGIATCSFSDEDFKTISRYFLENWNIKVSFFKDRTMYIPSKFRDKFTSIIKPFIHSDCLYKLHPESF